MKYHNIKHWDNTLSADQIFLEYAKDKTQVLSLFQSNPQALTTIWTDLLGMDNHCQMKMNKFSDFSCVGCQNLTHIMDIDNHVIGEPFEMDGSYLLLTKTNVPYPYLKFEQNKLKGDAFTMKVLFLWIIEDLFKIIPNAIQLKTAFICNYVGYNLYAAPTINKELCNMACLLSDSADVYGILSQLVMLFNELKKIHFVLGRPDINSFLFDKKPIAITYMEKKIKCQYTLCLADVADSSAIVNHIYLSGNRFTKDPRNRCVDVKGDQYKIKTNFKIEEINKPGLDFYLVLVSMFENDTFRTLANNDPDTLALMNQLWDHGGMMNRITNNEDLFENFWLHKDPVSVALNLL